MSNYILAIRNFQQQRRDRKRKDFHCQFLYTLYLFNSLKRIYLKLKINEIFAEIGNLEKEDVPPT